MPDERSEKKKKSSIVILRGGALTRPGDFRLGLWNMPALEYKPPRLVYRKKNQQRNKLFSKEISFAMFELGYTELKERKKKSPLICHENELDLIFEAPKKADFVACFFLDHQPKCFRFQFNFKLRVVSPFFSLIEIE